MFVPLNAVPRSGNAPGSGEYRVSEAALEQAKRMV
jgi:hypothetical protein